MKRNNLIVTLVTTLAVVAGVIGSIVAGARPQLGLDLQGGISAIYTPVIEPGQEPENLAEVLDETIEIVRSRVDSLGVAEPDISRQGTDVLVQLPGLQDADRAQEVIGTTAKLSFRPVVGLLPPGAPGYDETPPCIVPDPNRDGAYVLNPDRPAPPESEQGVVCGPLPATADGSSSPDETVTPTESDASETPSADDTASPSESTTPSEDASADESSSPSETETVTPTDTETATTGAADPDEVLVVAAQDESETVSEAPSPDTTDGTETTTDEPTPDATDPSAVPTEAPSELTEEQIQELLAQQGGGDPYATCPSYFADGAENSEVSGASESPTASESATPTESATPSESESPTDAPSEADTAAPAPGYDLLPADAPQPLKYQVCAAPLTGENIEDARPQLGNEWGVNLDLDGPGGDAFAFVTAQLACDRDQGGFGQFAIVLDDVVESAPGVNQSVPCGEGIQGGSATITVGGSSLDEQESEAADLSLVLRTGALPLTLVPSTFETVSPTLGSQSLRNGLLAGLIGLLLVAIYLIYFYRLLGVIAIGSLMIFGILMFGIITLLGMAGFALTLAGIAGIIVAIGITADSSILFFERIRDEIGLGKTMRSAVTRSFESAFRTNLAGNTVTAAAALILYLLAVGPVRGFALTLGIATVLDIFLLYVWTRPVVGLLAGAKKLTAKSVRGAIAAPTTPGGPA